MKVIQVDLNKGYSDVIRETVNVLNSGGTIIYPTDTLYGLGANAINEIAVRKIFRIKDRSFSKPLPVIVRDYSWVKKLANIKPGNEEIMKKVWPGKVTIVLTGSKPKVLRISSTKPEKLLELLELGVK